MSFQKLLVLDRASFFLDAQVLSSQTSGTFTGSSASLLGTQSWNMAAGYKAIITIENEQILLSGLSISGGTVTCTIDTRGYSGTSAATHGSGTLVEIHLTKAHFEALQDEVSTLNQGYITQVPVTTVSSASQHTISGDLASIFTVGRVFIFKIGSTWYRSVIRSSSYGGGTTTINLTGDGLPASGTVASAGFESFGSINKPVDYLLIREASSAPSDNPPAGYSWLFAKSKGWFAKDSDGKVRFLGIVRATAASSGGVLTLDWSTANVYDVDLTENIIGVTHQNGVEGEEYVLRLKQHASSAKTVALGTGGGTRYSDSIASYAVSSVFNAIDALGFRYHGTDGKFDLSYVMKGFAASPTGSAEPATKDDVKRNAATFTAGENINAGEPLIVEQATNSVRSTGTGANDASAGSSAWSNPGNITSDDNNYAEIGIGQHGNTTSQYLKATNFGFSIPSDAIIQGIKVEWRRFFVYSGPSSGASDIEIKLVKADGTIAGTNKSAGAGWAGAEQVDAFGGISDSWGETLTAADINDVDFGTVLRAQIMGTTGSPATGYARVDHCQMTVYYYLNGYVKRASASSTAVKGFCGIALETKTTGQAIKISKPGGISDAHTGLERGKFYYVGNTAGSLQQSAGTTTARVGLALSKTEMLVMHDVPA